MSRGGSVCGGWGEGRKREKENWRKSIVVLIAYYRESKAFTNTRVDAFVVLDCQCNDSLRHVKVCCWNECFSSVPPTTCFFGLGCFEWRQERFILCRSIHGTTTHLRAKQALLPRVRSPLHCSLLHYGLCRADQISIINSLSYLFIPFLRFSKISL